MAIRRSTATANDMLAALSDQLDLAFIYIFSGPVPDTADEALDMVSDHTELVKVGAPGATTGVTWDAPAAGILPKAAAETWDGVNTFDGADETSPATQTFFRICAAGDNGRGVANSTTGFRIQGTCGGPGSGADMELATTQLTAAATTEIGSGSLNLQPLDD